MCVKRRHHPHTHLPTPFKVNYFNTAQWVELLKKYTHTHTNRYSQNRQVMHSPVYSVIIQCACVIMIKWLLLCAINYWKQTPSPDRLAGWFGFEGALIMLIFDFRLARWLSMLMNCSQRYCSMGKSYTTLKQTWIKLLRPLSWYLKFTLSIRLIINENPDRNLIS